VQKQSFQQIWENSEVFRNLRDLSKYEGKCGRCEFIRVCGGCRARAYEKTGDYLAEEPLCLYEPGR
jgi:radical SAM protein with 4Fe4S-binding SPASM domain